MNPWCITKGKSNILVSYRFGQSVSTIFHSFRLRELLTGVQQMLNFIIFSSYFIVVYGLLSSNFYLRFTPSSYPERMEDMRVVHTRTKSFY